MSKLKNKELRKLTDDNLIEIFVRFNKAHALLKQVGDIKTGSVNSELKVIERVWLDLKKQMAIIGEDKLQEVLLNADVIFINKTCEKCPNCWSLTEKGKKLMESQ